MLRNPGRHQPQKNLLVGTAVTGRRTPALAGQAQGAQRREKGQGIAEAAAQAPRAKDRVPKFGDKTMEAQKKLKSSLFKWRTKSGSKIAKIRS